jgi:hypothetical protein
LDAINNPEHSEGWVSASDILSHENERKLNLQIIEGLMDIVDKGKEELEKEKKKNPQHPIWNQTHPSEKPVDTGPLAEPLNTMSKLNNKLNLGPRGTFLKKNEDLNKKRRNKIKAEKREASRNYHNKRDSTGRFCPSDHSSSNPVVLGCYGQKRDRNGRFAK